MTLTYLKRSPNSGSWVHYCEKITGVVEETHEDDMLWYLTWCICFNGVQLRIIKTSSKKYFLTFCCHLFIIAPRHNSRAASAVAYNNNNQVWDHILTVSHHHNESLMVSLTTQFNTMWRSAGIIRVKAPFTGAYKGNFVRVYCTIL